MCAERGDEPDSERGAGVFDSVQRRRCVGGLANHLVTHNVFMMKATSCMPSFPMTTTQDNRAATPPTTPRCSSLLVPTMDDAAACARRRRLCGRAEACIRAWERGDERACRALPVHFRGADSAQA